MTVSMSAQESVFVVLSTGPAPAWTSLPMSSPIIPFDAVATTKVERVLSSEQQTAFNRLKRIRLVQMSAQEAALLEGVIAVYPNRIITLHEEPLTNDSLIADQYALNLVGAKRAWSYATGKGVVVGILDTGIDWEHPDLVHQLAINADEDINGNGTFEPWSSALEINGVRGDLNEVDDDGNGYVDDVIGYDFVDQQIRNVGDDRMRDPIPFDEQGHGTSVAGIIAAQADNLIGIAGLARDARIVTMRAFDATGNAEEDDIAAALVYAAVTGVDVVNMSFGDGVDSPVLRDVVSFAASMGVVMVSSAGNTGAISRQYPAGYDDVIAIGATTADDEKAFFSSTGSLVFMSAPGDKILTTAVGGRYRTVNGTSFSSPYVAAAAAMLLEHRPNLTAVEIAGILASSSLDLGEKGWDGDFGAGRLRVDKALEHQGAVNVNIEHPRNEQEVDPALSNKLEVTGSAIAPLLDGYTVELGRGLEPAQWNVIASSAEANVGGVLAVVELTDLEAGLYVVRLNVALKDGRSLESRRRINVLSNGPLAVTSAEIINAWSDDRRVAVLTIETNRPTHLVATSAITGSTFRDSVTDNLRFTRVHSITLDPAPFGNGGNVDAVLTADNGETVQWNGSYDLGLEAMPTVGWTSRPAAGWAGYVLDEVEDVYEDGSQVFAMADLSSGVFGPMLTVDRDGSNWRFRDTTSEVFIPRGMGDANNNGRLEIFGHVVGQAVLFEAASSGGNPFDNRIFSLNDGRSNAAGMADLDGDGIQELLVLSDSGCSAYGYRNGQFVFLSMAVNPTPPSIGNVANRVDEISVAAADVDGDGLVEVAFGDTDGDLVIAEYTPTGFRIETTIENEGVGGSGFVGKVDIDGDGVYEFFQGVPDNAGPDVRGEYGRQVWTYSLYGSTGIDSYAPKWVEHFHGVRYGIGYRNGFGAGNIDDIKGEEIVICAFPRMFVFGQNRQGKIVPKYYRPNVVSPRFLTHDFDNNGVTELGFGTTVEELGVMTDFRFIEQNSQPDRLQAPTGVRAQMTGPNTAHFSWLPVEGAGSYRVFGATSVDGLFRVIDTVVSGSITIDTLSQDIGYRFRVSALSLNDDLEESFRSEIVDVGRNTRVTVSAVVPDTVTLGQLVEGVTLQVYFGGPMPERLVEPSAYLLFDEQGDVVGRALSAITAGDNVIVVRFSSVKLNQGAELRLHVGSQLDRRGMPTLAYSRPLQVVSTKAAPELILTKLDVESNVKASLRYSQSVDESALVAGNYNMSPIGSIERVERVNDSTVTLFFDSSQPLAALGTTYSITARNVVANTGTAITTGAGNTVSFVLTAADLASVFVYPHPASLENQRVTFANLTRDATIEILDQRFNQVLLITEIDGNGGAAWDMRDRQGTLVNPGLYFYRVSGQNTTGSSEESGFRKIMIVR